MNAPCARCGVRAARTTRTLCPDCKSLGYRERPYWARQQVTAAAHQPCECGDGTWATCVACARVTAHLNNQRLHRRRAAS